MIIPLFFLLGLNLFGQHRSDHPCLLCQALTRTDSRQMHLADLNGAGVHEYLVEVPQTGGARTTLRVYKSDLHRLIFRKNFQSQLLTLAGYPTNRILIAVKNTLEKCDLSLKTDHLKKDFFSRDPMIGDSRAIKKVFNLID